MTLTTGDRWIVAGTRASIVFTAPVFTDDTGAAQSWIVGTAITDVTVSAASGLPAPTYAVVGALPTGVQFNITTRIISGTPTMGESGTITIRATNSEGFDDWTVAYTTVSVAALAGEVPAPEATLTAESAYSIAALVGEVPAPAAVLTAESAYSLAALVGEVPAPESALTAESAYSLAALEGEVPAPEATLTATPVQVAALVGEVPAPEATLTAESAYALAALVRRGPCTRGNLNCLNRSPSTVRLGATCLATDLEFSALLERTASGVFLYQDANRGGTDTPLEGDLNLGADDTEISQIQWNTNRLIINDNDDPAALSLEAYFQSGGEWQ